MVGNLDGAPGGFSSSEPQDDGVEQPNSIIFCSARPPFPSQNLPGRCCARQSRKKSPPARDSEAARKAADATPTGDEGGGRKRPKSPYPAWEKKRSEQEQRLRGDMEERARDREVMSLYLLSASSGGSCDSSVRVVHGLRLKMACAERVRDWVSAAALLATLDGCGTSRERVCQGLAPQVCATLIRVLVLSHIL